MTGLTLTWTNVFPEARVESVLKYVAESWEDLTSTFPSAHAFEVREEKLTDSLAHHLDDPVRRQRRGIPGRFVSEQWNLRRSPSGEIKRESRSDIIYLDAVPGAPRLVMEFKKLAGVAKLHQLYCSEGILRFVQGLYTPEQKIGGMCGIVKPGCADPNALISFLSSLPAGVAKELGCDEAGYGVKSPSVLAPSVATCDSVHARGANCGNGDITLAHVFVTSAQPAT